MNKQPAELKETELKHEEITEQAPIEEMQQTGNINLYTQPVRRGWRSQIKYLFLPILTVMLSFLFNVDAKNIRYLFCGAFIFSITFIINEGIREAQHRVLSALAR